MAAVIFLKPKTCKGREILDRLEEEVNASRCRSSRTAPAATTWTARMRDADAFDPMLDKIASDWRDHVSNSTPT
jgi:hypothetical protein